MKALSEPRSVKRRALVALVGLVVLGGIAWVGWRLVEQDRAVENERLRERLEAAASVVCAEVDRAVTEWEQALGGVGAGASPALPQGSTVVFFSASGAAWQAGVRLPYLPIVAASPGLPPTVFAKAEAAEFRERDYRKAETLYRAELRRGGLAERAAGWMGVARCLRRQNRTADALDAYAQLASFGAEPAGGSPAALTAAHERLAMFLQLGDRQAARNEAERLRANLDEGRFPIDQATYDFFRAATAEVVPGRPPGDQFALADALVGAWSRASQAPPDDLRAWHLRASTNDFVVLLRQRPPGAAMLVAPASALAARLASQAAAFHAAMQVLDERGVPILGGVPLSDLEVTKTPVGIRLPWSVRLGSADPAAARSAAAARRGQLLAVLALVLLALAGAGYATYRAVDREVTVARLQSDFVAAVSHEFRTPLAAMCHLTESLEDGRVDESRRPAYYRTLARENRRLREMVENLLDFARMDSGRQVYRKDPLHLEAVVHDVVASVREHLQDDRRVVALDMPSRPCGVRGDPEALARAVRNLLDNAVKYSPAGAQVCVSVSADRHDVRVSVADVGPGIPKAEQSRIFSKFLRGSSARTLNVKGTGIGLAMVRHIVDGHGGRIEVDSEPGRGSRFTIVLPVDDAKPQQETS